MDQSEARQWYGFYTWLSHNWLSRALGFQGIWSKVFRGIRMVGSGRIQRRFLIPKLLRDLLGLRNWGDS